MPQSSRSHPYAALEGTVEWVSIDQALGELARNEDLVETTDHKYIVGYLCQALIPPHDTKNAVVNAHRATALARLRRIVRDANPANRDLVAELIAERQTEALHG